MRRRIGAADRDVAVLLRELEMQNKQLRRSLQDLEVLHDDYVQLYDHAPVGYVILSRKGVIRSLNRAAGRLLGKPKESIEQMPFSGFVAGKDAKNFLPHLKEVFAGRRQNVCRLWLGRRGSSPAYVELHSILLSGQKNREAACLSSLVDITARMQAEDALKVSEERFHFALAASRMGVWEWDIRTNVVFWSQECFDMLGIRTRKCTLDSFTDLLHPDDAPGVMSAARTAIANGQGYHKEFRIIRPDGRMLWLSNTGKAEYDKAGTPLRLIGTVQDITERKKLEDAVAIREKSLAAFFRGATAGLALVDKDLRYIKINKTMADMNGVPAEVHIGKVVKEIVPDVAPAIEPILRKVLSTGKPVLDVRLSGKTQNKGLQRHWIASYFPVDGTDSRPEAVGAIVSEVTAQKWAEEKAHDYARELKEMNNALQVLLRKREQDRKELEEKVMVNMRQLVLPYIELLKKGMAQTSEQAVPLDMMQSSLEGIVSSFATNLSRKIAALSPKEILVADLVRAGNADKDISQTLHISIDTVKAHRRNIRKKLGLAGGRTNLRTFLTGLYTSYNL